MSDIQPTPLPETPWEFYPDDDIRVDNTLAPEDAAMRITRTTGPSTGGDPQLVTDTVHYFEDEEPEVPDPTEPAPDYDHTPDVEDLLIRQHYLPTPDEEQS